MVTREGFLTFAGFPILLAVFRLLGYAISSEDDCACATSVKPNTPNTATVNNIPAGLRHCNKENLEVSGAVVMSGLSIFLCQDATPDGFLFI